MRNRRNRVRKFGIGAIAALLLGAEDSAPLPPPRLERVADGVWIHQSHAEVRGFGAVLSQGLVVARPDGAVMVDTAWTDRDTELLLGRIEREAGAPVRTLIVTHAHNDKMGGMGAAQRAGIRSYAHARTNLDAPARGLGVATDALSLEAGEATSLAGLVVFFPGGGHTRDNLVVYFAPARVLFGGCLIRPAAAKDLGNTADADVGHWAAAVRAVAERFPGARVVIPSHGPAGGRELLDHTIALAEARAAIERLKKSAVSDSL